MHKDFYKTNKKYVNFLYKNHPYFYFSFSAELIRLHLEIWYAHITLNCFCNLRAKSV